MSSYHASIREKLVQIIDTATAPMTLQDVFDRMEGLILSENASLSDYDLEVTEQHTDPRWKVRTRSMIATMAANGDLVARVSRGYTLRYHFPRKTWRMMKRRLIGPI